MRYRGGWACALLCAAVLVLPLPGVAANTDAAAHLPPGVLLPKNLKLPQGATLGIYIPANQRETRFYVDRISTWIEMGKAIQDAALAASRTFYRVAGTVEWNSQTPFNVLLVLHPKFDFKDGNITLTLAYRFIGPGGEQLFAGTKSSTAKFSGGTDASSIYDPVLRATQLALVDFVVAHPTDSAPSGTGTAAAMAALTLVNHEKAVATGTGFYINRRGQVLTAAHVTHDCPLSEVKRDGKVLPAKLVAESLLLDLAVIDTGEATEHALPLRTGTDFQLGEGVTDVGFPLEGVLAGSPNLTRGNISSRAGLNGAQGVFQFSAPIQPGSSGGPVVSDGGELLGITVATLNVSGLIAKGVLPQNVNFALDARYASMFLRKNSIEFVSVAANPKGDMRTANDAALAAVVQLTCFQ